MVVRANPVYRVGVVKLYDDRCTGKTEVHVDHVRAAVMFWQTAERGVPKLVMAIFKAGIVDDHLELGGPSRLVEVKNAAIGRRICPDCYAAGTKVPVKERGQVGVCSSCGKQADYTITSYPPYFFYFSYGKSTDLHIGFDSMEQQIADSMKIAMVSERVRDLILPVRVRGQLVDCNVPAFFHPVVFSFEMQSLKGSFGKTVFDFQAQI